MMRDAFPPSQQIRGLVDCDSFYASCETYLNPQLRGLPVCIGRDIVIARSYEAKPYGVKVGTPIREAKKMLPNSAVYLAPRMKEYGKISQSLMHYLRQKCLQVEVFSIDEAFFEITGYADRYDMSYKRIAAALKHDIKKNIGIPVSIGLGPTRLLAKIFADINKPFGECVGCDQQHIDHILQSLPLADVPFIGPKTQQKLQYICTTAYDFATLPYTYVKQLLGKNGLVIRCELNCINAASYAAKEQPKGIRRTQSFNPFFTNKSDEVRSHLTKNIEKAVEHLMDVQMKVGYIRISFRTKEFTRFGYDRQLTAPTNDRGQIIQICRELFAHCRFGNVWYRTTGVIFGDLVDARTTQQSLFDGIDATLGQKNNLNTIIYQLNKQYGRGTVQVGAPHQTAHTNNNDSKKNELCDFAV